MDMYKLKKIYNMPLSKVVKLIFEKSFQVIKHILIKYRDLSRDTHITKDKYIDFSYIDINAIDISNIDSEAGTYLCDMYLNHCFDLLGSGYVNVTYDMDCNGLEGNIYDESLHIYKFDIEGNFLKKILRRANLNYAQNIWKHIDIGYIPIDWQMDFKSGFRYSQKEWYLDGPIGKKEGVDIKVPWELGRLQHLPQLATLAAAFPEKREAILKEFRNQILDFIMANPPRIGVQWGCTMDVSIRVSNMLIAFDMLKQLDLVNILDDYFIKLLSLSVYEHGCFIISNLEWYKGLTSNHYLSDICGLTFVSAYLRGDDEVDSWLAFSVQEIISESYKQFYEEGSNFEGSTSYHRLSGELLIYTTSLVYGITKTSKINALTKYKANSVKRLLPLSKQLYDVFSKDFFPKEYIQKIYRAALFTADITKQNGNICQIGDNDSGRFFKFSLNGQLLKYDDANQKYINLKENKLGRIIYFDENILNHNTFISAVNGIFDDEKLCTEDKYNLEKSIIRSLSKDKKFRVEAFNYKVNLYKESPRNLKYSSIKKIAYSDFTSKLIDINNMQVKCYPRFGVYIFKSNNFYLSVRTGGVSQNGNGVHGHNDVLSFELNLGGVDIYVDQGTYLYTPLPKVRDKFRSIKAHNIPIIDNEEQCNFTGIFSMDSEIKCEVLSLKRDNIVLYAVYRDIKILREFTINWDNLIIIDRCNSEFYENINTCKLVSNGYGKLMKLNSNTL